MYGASRSGSLGTGPAGRHGLVVDWYCKLSLGKAGMDGSGEAGRGVSGRVEFWQAWRAKEIPVQSWYETVSPGKAGEVRRLG